MEHAAHSGRVALVTGASRGIGAATARRLAREGLRVALLGRAEGELRALAGELAGLAVVADVTDAAAVALALAAVESALGPIDVLVNNAGVAESAPLTKLSDEAWARAFEVNVTAVFRLCRAVMPGMAARGWGRVVNVASNAGLTGYAYTAAYCASKHAVVGLTRALAAEFARTGVTVNAVCPGFVDTEMTARAATNIAATTRRSEDDARAALAALSPQNRLMTADEVAYAVFALVPHEARGIHGQAIPLDGGQVLR
jgi:NAD(P)-dependent dehydrogenase (short-subunit alcohol dehydrogenase family)